MAEQDFCRNWVLLFHDDILPPWRDALPEGCCFSFEKTTNGGYEFVPGDGVPGLTRTPVTYDGGKAGDSDVGKKMKGSFTGEFGPQKTRISFSLNSIGKKSLWISLSDPDHVHASKWWFWWRRKHGGSHGVDD